MTKKVTILVGLDLSTAFDTVSHDTPLNRLQRVRGDRNGTILDPILPEQPVAVCQAGSPPVTSREPQRRRPSRISIGTSTVRHLL